MTNGSIFDFLKEDEQFSSIYKNCIGMEKIINIKEYDSAVSKSRKISESLLKIIIKNQFHSLYDQLIIEKINKGPFTSFCKLIDKVYDEGLISLDIKNKYHKIRIWGNDATHAEDFDLEDILKILDLEGFIKYFGLENFRYITNLNNSKREFDLTDFKNHYDLNNFEKEFDFDDAKEAHKIIFYLSLDCFEKFNKDKAKGIKYQFRLDDIGSIKIDIDKLLQDIDLTQYDDEIIKYCKENILIDLSEKKITEKEVKAQFEYYVESKETEAINLRIHSDLFYNLAEPEVELLLTQEEKFEVYENVKDMICDGFKGSVYDLLVEEMTKIVDENQNRAKTEFEKYSNRLSDLTDLTDDEIDEYIKLILSFIENNEIKVENISEIFIIKTGNEYHLMGKISKYMIYVAKYIDELLNDLDLSKYDEDLVEKCKNNILTDLFDRRITEKKVKTRFEYCVSKKERERQNIIEFMDLYHNPTEPSNEILLTQEEKDAVYEKVEKIIHDDYSGSVLELIIKEIDLVLEDNKNKAKKQFEKYIDDRSNFTELTGLDGIEIDNYISQILEYIENYDLKEEHITESVIINTAKEYHSKGSINKRRMVYYALNDEPVLIISDSEDELDVSEVLGSDEVPEVLGRGDSEDELDVSEVLGSDEVPEVLGRGDSEDELDVSEVLASDVPILIIGDSDDVGDIEDLDSIDETADEFLTAESIMDKIPLFKKEKRAELLSKTGLNGEEANEYIEEILYLINEELSIEKVTEEFIIKTGSEYHTFGIIDIN